MEGKLGHTGSGGQATADESAYQRKQRLQSLLINSIDITNDPYFMRNHLGSYECKLCLTIHLSEGNYLAHTQAKRHQQNLLRRNIKLAKHNPSNTTTNQPNNNQQLNKPIIKRIGRPGYRLMKQYDSITAQRSIVWQIEYPLCYSNIQPRNRFMSSIEHKQYCQTNNMNMNNIINHPQHDTTDINKYQYILFACDPYDIIGFAIPAQSIDRATNKLLTHWDDNKKLFTLQLYFKT